MAPSGNSLKALISEVRRLRYAEAYDEALEVCNRAIEQYPDRHELYQERGFVFDSKGDPERAMADADVAVSLTDGDATSRFVRGQRRLEAGKYVDALADLDAVIAVEVEEGDPYFTAGADLMRAFCFVKLRQFVAAREICQRLEPQTTLFVLGAPLTVERVAAMASGKR